MRTAPRDFQSETATGSAEQAAPSQAAVDPFEIHVVPGDRVDAAGSIALEQDDAPPGDPGRAGEIAAFIASSTERVRKLPDWLRASPTARALSITGALGVAFAFGWACALVFDDSPEVMAPPPAQRADLIPAKPESQRDVRRGHRIAGASASRNPAPVEASKKSSASAASAANTRLIAAAVAQLQAEPQTTSSIPALPASGDASPPPPLSPPPETRPTTIPGWSVRDVEGEKAILVGPDRIWTVRTGDSVPGVGRIDSIVRWGNRWIVATSAGLISTE